MGAACSESASFISSVISQAFSPSTGEGAGLETGLVPFHMHTSFLKSAFKVAVCCLNFPCLFSLSLPTPGSSWPLQTLPMLWRSGRGWLWCVLQPSGESDSLCCLLLPSLSRHRQPAVWQEANGEFEGDALCHDGHKGTQLKAVILVMEFNVVVLVATTRLMYNITLCSRS